MLVALAVNRFNDGDMHMQVLETLFLRDGSQQSKAMVEHLFRLFDSNQNGTVEWGELVHGVTVLCEGSAEEKLQAFFLMVNRRRNGKVSRQELLEFFRSISQTPIDSGRLETMVDRIILEADRDMTGTITLSELIRWEGRTEILAWLGTVTQHFKTRLQQFHKSASPWHLPTDSSAPAMLSVVSVHDALPLCRSTLQDPVAQSHIDALLEKLAYLEVRVTARDFADRFFEVFGPVQGKVPRAKVALGVLWACKGAWQEKLLVRTHSLRCTPMGTARWLCALPGVLQGCRYGWQGLPVLQRLQRHARVLQEPRSVSAPSERNG